MPNPSHDEASAGQATVLPLLNAGLDAPQPPVAGDQQRMAFVLSLRERGISDVELLRAMETIPREIFVPHHFADLAWRDIALPIACGQTMLQPFAVARTMAALEIEPHHRILEIGAGSGYATAILARLAREVVSFERFRSLARTAQLRLESLGCHNANVRWADGFDLPAEAGSFDRILIDAAINLIPRALLAALAPGGLIIYPRKAGTEGQGQTFPDGLYSMRRTPAGQTVDFLFGGRYTASIPGRSSSL